MVTTVPPCTGPSTGCTDWISGAVYVKAMPSAVKSTPFTATSSSMVRASCAGATHSSTSLDTRRAAEGLACPKRHKRAPSAAERCKNGPPCTLTRVPPPAGPWGGRTILTDGGPRNSNSTPLALKSWLFMLTSRVTLPARPTGRETHESEPAECQVAATGTPKPKRHAKPGPRTNPLPATVTSAPPSTVPAWGLTLETDHCSRYSYSSRLALKSCMLLVISMAYNPLAWAGETQRSSLPDTKLAARAATAPNRHVLPGKMLLPTTLTRLCPRCGPD